MNYLLNGIRTATQLLIILGSIAVLAYLFADDAGAAKGCVAARDHSCSGPIGEDQGPSQNQSSSSTSHSSSNSERRRSSHAAVGSSSTADDLYRSRAWEAARGEDGATNSANGRDEGGINREDCHGGIHLGTPVVFRSDSGLTEFSLVDTCIDGGGNRKVIWKIPRHR